MKTKASLMNWLKSRFAIALFAVVMAAPVSLYAQNDGNDEAEPAAESNSGAGPWGNSAGSSVGSQPSSSSTTTDAAASDPRRGALARPAGPTPDATGGPGGNPDVPFDTSMNLMFLAGGIAFAYVVYRRRLKLKPVAAEKK